MEKTLQDYLLGVKKEYKYILRVADKIDDSQMESIERYLKKHDLLDISAPKETIFQSNANGFDGSVNSEITIVEFTLGLPVGYHKLEEELARNINVSDARVNVDFAEGYSYEDVDFLDHDEEYKSKLNIDPEYPEDKYLPDSSELTGDKYNQEMLDKLQDARDSGDEDIQTYKQSKYSYLYKDE